ncbi:MAG: CinA family protein [Methylotenera sp.]
MADLDSEINMLAAQLGIALKAHGKMLTLAESCTGGMLASAITNIAGSSVWFDRGFVTYSNAAKIEMLGVSADTIETKGAVSVETAAEMAQGALAHSAAQVSASITGIAGPDGGSAQKPVGTVCFAWMGSNIQLQTSVRHFKGDRHAVRQQATIYIMTELLNALVLSS